MLAHVARIPVEESLTPSIISAGAALVAFAPFAVGRRTPLLAKKHGGNREEGIEQRRMARSGCERHTRRARGGRPDHLSGRTGCAAGSGEGAHSSRRRDCVCPSAVAHGEVDPTIRLIGPHGPITLLEAFEGRRQLIAYYFMWSTGRPAAEQCEGCTWFTTQVTELSHLHSRDITFAVFCKGPYNESIRYHDFMGWKMPWYSAEASLDALLPGRDIRMMYLACYVRDSGARLRNLLDDHPRRRGNGQHLPAHGPHCLRAPGDVGGLASRLATTRRQRQPADERTPRRPVVATRSWTLRRARIAASRDRG